jgi:hypothetical protein
LGHPFHQPKVGPSGATPIGFVFSNVRIGFIAQHPPKSLGSYFQLENPSSVGWRHAPPRGPHARALGSSRSAPPNPVGFVFSSRQPPTKLASLRKNPSLQIWFRKMRFFFAYFALFSRISLASFRKIRLFFAHLTG